MIKKNNIYFYFLFLLKTLQQKTRIFFFKLKICFAYKIVYVPLSKIFQITV